MPAENKMCKYLLSFGAVVVRMPVRDAIVDALGKALRAEQ